METVPFRIGLTILRLNPIKIFLLLFLAIQLTYIAATDQLLLQATNQITTTNDGVTSDKYVSYIQLNGLQGIQLTLDTIKLNQRLNYTVMTWFKSTSNQFGQDYQYTFSFGDSLECYFSSDQKLICSSESFLDRLEVDTTQLKTNQWFHLTVAGKIQDTSYVLIQSNALGVITQDEEYYLDLIQKTTPWKACLGGCYNQNIFVGGLRDFIFLNTYVNQLQAANLKNKYLFWDSKLITYYRFSEYSFLQDEINGKQVQISSGAYIQQKDMISNDICYPIETYIQLYKAQKTQDFKKVAVTARWTPKQTNWGYTVNMWIKLNPNHCYTQSPTIAQGNCHLVYLNQAFLLYSPAPNQVSAYIYASKIYYEYQTKSIFVPNNQWVNIQFTINQFLGYEFRTFDILSRQMSFVSETRELYPQKVSDKSFQILKNFNSVIKNLVVYSSRQNLPFTPPKVDLALNNYTLSNDCMMYFDFSSQGFANLLPRQLRNLCSPKSDFPLNVDLVPQNEIYQGAYWTEPILIAGSDIGLSTNPTKLFDGIACNDGQAVVNFGNSKGYIYTKTLPQQNQLNNVTVEFWFKQGYNSSSQTQVITNTNYLFSLYGPMRSREFFTISYDSIQKKLICAPFGQTGVSSPQVAFTQYTQTNRGRSGWFHIACQFEQLNEVVGYLHNNVLSDEILRQPLTGISTNLLQDTFEVWLGNNAQKASGSTYLSVKELRLWALKRTYNDIQYWRYSQIDARLFDAASLMVYLRLNVGSYNEFNLMKTVYPSTTYSDVNMTEVLYVSDSELSLCPVGTYLGSDSKCYQNPIQSIQANVYPELINSELNYVFTSEDTVIMSQASSQFIQYQWEFEDQILQKIVKTLGVNKNPIMHIPTKYFKNENNYQVTLNISNKDNTFVLLKQINFIPKSCSFYQLADQTTSLINMTDPQSRVDLSFMVQSVSLKSYCDEISYYNQLIQDIDYSFVPPLANNVSLVFQFFSNNSFQVSIPAKEQYKIPIQTPITIILGLSFQNSQISNLFSDSQISNNVVFQNLKQVIYFNSAGQTVIPAISANQTTVAIGEGVSLSTQGTRITYADPSDYNNIYYQWLCPDALLYYCPLVNASQITIPANNPINFKGASDYQGTITVNISWTDKNQIEFVTNISITIRFINQLSPGFTISATNPLRASYDSLFTLDFTNHRSSNLPTSMTITWDISPQIQFVSQTYGTRNSFLKVAKNGFQFSRTYKITVNATNRNTTELLSRTQVFTFTTQKPPLNGTVNITPTSGYVNETQMTITILNWQSSNQPTTYKVFPYKDSTKVSTVALTDSWISETTPFRFTPNDTYYYQIWITDTAGELSIVNVMPNITVKSNTTNGISSNLTWDIKQAQLNQIISTPQVSEKYSALLDLTKNLQQGTSSDSSSSEDQASPDALFQMQTNLAILNTLQQDTDQVSTTTDQSEDSIIISKGAVKVLELILSNTYIINDDIAEKALVILRKIYNPYNSVIENINQDPNFKENFALVLSHLIKYDNSLSNSDRIRRMLQQESTLQEDIRQLKELLTNQLCQDAVQNSDPQSIDTPSFSIVIRKYSYDTSITEGDLKREVSDSPILQFSISSISQQLKPIKSYDDAFCLESIFSSVDASIKHSVFQQYSKQIIEYQVTDEQSGSSYTTNQYDPQSNVKIIFPVNAETYLNNQTVCMAYSNISKIWSDDICETLVDTVANNVRCYCNPTDVKSYGVFNNPTRILGETLIFTPKASTSQAKGDYIQTDESFSFFALILILVVFSLVLPTILMVLDKRDAKQIKNRKIENSLKQQVVIISKYSNLPYKYWLTRIDDIIEFSQPHKSLFSHLVQELHPVINLMSKYDILNSRITRFISYLLQIAIYSFVVVLVFGPSYRQGQQNRFEYGIDQKDISAILAVGLLGTIILLPFNAFNRLYKRSIMNKSVPQNQSVFQTVSNENKEINYILENSMDKQCNKNFSPNQDLQTIQRINYKSNGLESLVNGDLFGLGRQSNLQKYENSQDLKLHSRFKPLLIAQMVISYLICLVTIGLCFVNAQNMPVSNQYCLVASFYIGFFGSILVSNFIRIGANALLVKNFVENQGSCFLRLIIARETIELYKDKKMIELSVKTEGNENTEIQNLSLKKQRNRLPKINNSNKKQNKETKQMSIDMSGADNSLKRGQIDTQENIDSNHSAIVHQEIVRQNANGEKGEQHNMSPDEIQIIDFNTKTYSSSNSSRKSRTEINKNLQNSSPIKFYTSVRKNKTKVVEMSPDDSLDRYSDIGSHSNPQIQQLDLDEQDHHFV